MFISLFVIGLFVGKFILSGADEQIGLRKPDPVSSIQHPVSSIQHPVSSIQYPASSIHLPSQHSTAGILSKRILNDNVVNYRTKTSIHNKNTIMIKLTSFKLASLLLFLFASASVRSQGITTPRTRALLPVFHKRLVSLQLSVNYSRPSVKGREVWGALVPYGWNVQAFGASNSAPWRAGANENTVIKFSHAA